MEKNDGERKGERKVLRKLYDGMEEKEQRKKKKNLEEWGRRPECGRKIKREAKKCI